MSAAHGNGTGRIVDLANLTHGECLLLDQAAAEIREPYNDLIARVASQHVNSIVWLCGSLASRHTNLSSTFIRCCQIALVGKLLENEGPIEEVITDSSAMRRVLQQLFKQRGVDTKARYSLPLLSRLRNWLWPLRNLASSLRHIISLYVFSKLIKREQDFDLKDPITLLDCFVVGSSFDEESDVYHDRYYPGFIDALTQKERASTYFLPAFVGVKNYRRTLRKIRSNSRQFLLKEDFLRLQDYVVAFVGMVRVRWLAKSLPEEASRFLGVSLLPLMQEEIRRTCTNLSSVLAVLNYRFMKRLRERTIPVRLVVDWNENQVIDKGLIKGVHDYFPGTPVVGYQGFIVSPLYHIYLQPTDFEVSLGVIPDEIAVVGAGLVNRVKEFCPALSVTVAPAARFEEVWQDRSSTPPEDEQYVLLALSIDLKESVEILRLVAEAVQGDRLRNCKVMIKLHPTYSQNRIMQTYGLTWPARFRFARGSFHDCLDHACLLIGNTSSTCVEALARGIPVIVIGGQSGLTQNPIPCEIKEDIWRLCYTAREVADAIDEYRARTPEEVSEHVRVGREIRKRYFEPTTRHGIRKFLRLPQ